MKNFENIISETGVPVKGTGRNATCLDFYNKMEYVNAEFEPLEDITAFELAKLIPYFNGKPLTKTAIVEMGTAARHLKRK